MSGFFAGGASPTLPLTFAGVGRATFAATGGKLTFREWNPAEHFAGVFPAAGTVAALLGGDTVIQHLHQ